MTIDSNFVYNEISDRLSWQLDLGLRKQVKGYTTEWRPSWDLSMKLIDEMGKFNTQMIWILM